MNVRLVLKDVYNANKVISIDKYNITSIHMFMICFHQSMKTFSETKIWPYMAKLTTRSLPEIGRKFANRDHTTVIHAVKTIKN